MEKTLHTIKLNEIWTDKNDMCARYRRVPGGWLFQDKIFIPWSDEFNQNVLESFSAWNNKE